MVDPGVALPGRIGHKQHRCVGGETSARHHSAAARLAHGKARLGVDMLGRALAVARQHRPFVERSAGGHYSGGRKLSPRHVTARADWFVPVRFVGQDRPFAGNTGGRALFGTRKRGPWNGRDRPGSACHAVATSLRHREIGGGAPLGALRGGPWLGMDGRVVVRHPRARNGNTPRRRWNASAALFGARMRGPGQVVDWEWLVPLRSGGSILTTPPRRETVVEAPIRRPRGRPSEWQRTARPGRARPGNTPPRR